MPVTSQSYGTRITNCTAAVHSGSGRVTALLISHVRETAQAVILYDALTCAGEILACIQVAPGQCPVWIAFPDGLRFSRGLSINAGDCEVNLWA